MAIAYVGEIGTVTKDPAGTTSVITVGASGVTAGNHIIIVGALQGSNVVTSVADTGGNTYTVDRTHSTAGTATANICSAHVATGLVNGNTITITHPSSVGSFLAEEFSGVHAYSGRSTGWPRPGAASSTAISTGSTATLTASTELMVVAVTKDGAHSITLTNITSGMSNFTTERLTTPTTTRTIYGRYKLNVGTTAVDYTGTLSTARVHNEAVVTYMEAGAAVNATVTLLAPARAVRALSVPTLDVRSPYVSILLAGA